jgi:hypothetical protein
MAVVSGYAWLWLRQVLGRCCLACCMSRLGMVCLGVGFQWWRELLLVIASR